MNVNIGALRLDPRDNIARRVNFDPHDTNTRVLVERIMRQGWTHPEGLPRLRPISDQDQEHYREATLAEAERVATILDAKPLVLQWEEADAEGKYHTVKHTLTGTTFREWYRKALCTEVAPGCVNVGFQRSGAAWLALALGADLVLVYDLVEYPSLAAARADNLSENTQRGVGVRPLDDLDRIGAVLALQRERGVERIGQTELYTLGLGKNKSEAQRLGAVGELMRLCPELWEVTRDDMLRSGDDPFHYGIGRLSYTRCAKAIKALRAALADPKEYARVVQAFIAESRKRRKATDSGPKVKDAAQVRALVADAPTALERALVGQALDTQSDADKAVVAQVKEHALLFEELRLIIASNDPADRKIVHMIQSRRKARLAPEPQAVAAGEPKAKAKAKK